MPILWLLGGKLPIGGWQNSLPAKEDMALAIEQICQLSDAQWRKMSEKALETVINYTWEDATALFEAALDRGTGTSARINGQGVKFRFGLKIGVGR